jgi:DNA-directed RNA polymerase specialized sigma24 family protein
LSCAEIAVALNKPSISAVTSHLYRAMQHLRGALERSGWFSEYSSQDLGERAASRRRHAM